MQNKFKQEKAFGLILKSVSLLKCKINYTLLILLCRRVGFKVKVMQLPIITGGKNISIGNNVFIGRNVQLIAPFGASIVIGDNVEIRDGVRLYAKNIIIESGVTLGEHAFLYGNIQVKNGCWISRGCDISGEVHVGKAILGPYVRCISSNHGRAQDGAVCMDQNSTQAMISIEDGAWVGMNATILKGVVIKKNSVVGAGSVVTKSVTEGRVVAGVPAKEIRSDLDVGK